MNEFRGIPVSPGVAIGRVFLLDDVRRRIPRRRITAADIERELGRLDAALEASLADLEQIRQKAEDELGAEAAKIFAFHSGMLRDPAVVEPMRESIRDDLVVAEWAVQEQFRVVAQMFEAMPDTAFSTKVDDVWDLDHRVLKHLVGATRTSLEHLAHDAIVVGADLTPSQTATFPRGENAKGRVLGFATDLGGPTSHTAIFARALGIPAAVGVGDLAGACNEGDTLIVDGDRGVVIRNPDERTLERYRGIIERDERLRIELAGDSGLESATLDGTPVALLGNVEFAEESATVASNGGGGVGLFRTEFLWLTGDTEPTEDEQYREYRRAIELLDGRPITIRTFDLGADKQTQARAAVRERNPALGCRSIRYCLQNIPMFKRQLRAILRAATAGPTRIMFPLVTTTTELRQAKMILADVVEELAEEGVEHAADVPVGMMVEVPSVAVMAHTFAREAAFFSIGTNDLVQYTLAVDRTNERVANLYSAAHPAVIRLIKDVVRAGRRQKIDVSICGEVGADAAFTMLLIGLGLRTLSVTPNRIPYLKKVIRNVDKEECERLARRVGSFDSERQVAGYLRDQARQKFPEFADGRAVDPEPA